MQLYMKNLLKWTRLKMTTILNVFEEYFDAKSKGGKSNIKSKNKSKRNKKIAKMR